MSEITEENLKELQQIFAAHMNVNHMISINFVDGVPKVSGRQGRHVPLVIAVAWEYFQTGFKLKVK